MNSSANSAGRTEPKVDATGSASPTSGAVDGTDGSSGELYVIAEFVSKPDAADALRALLVPFGARVQKEPGCHEYTLMEVEGEPGRFITHERWTGHAALDAHMKTPDITALAPKIQLLLAKAFTQTFLRKARTA